jgi:coenzyme F420 biosynthesis associated uncharacterized protein
VIDWSLAERIAGIVAGSPPAGALPRDLAAFSEEAAQRVTDYTGLHPIRALPTLEAVDRQTWAAANLDLMRPVIDPVSERLGSGLGPVGGLVRPAADALIAAELGTVTGLLSQRVLGQYELSLLEAERPTRLLLVGPNLREAARGLDADRDDLVRWVAVHEICHAVQFSAVPWLREHLAATLRELLDGLEIGIDAGALLRMPTREDLRGLLDSVREGGLLTAMLGGERRLIVDRLQAAMSMIEGHAEHVMDAVGAEVLASLPELRAALERRRRERPTAWRLLERLLGLDLKMRQYANGKRFCDEVVARAGMRALDAAWKGPEQLPTLAEFDDPEAWLRRTHVPPVTSAHS